MNSRLQSITNSAAMLVCTFLIAAILLGTLSRSRAAARNSACADNLRSIGLAFHNYHAAYKTFPFGTGGTTGSDDPAGCNAGRLSPLVALLPFVEHQALWEQIANPYRNPKTGKSFPPMGPIPSYDASAYEPWGKAPSVYRCPDAGGDEPVDVPKVLYTLESPQGSVDSLTNYVANFGDGTVMQGQFLDDPNDHEVQMRRRAANRGAFMTSQALKMRDFLDGTSNTILYSETVASEKRDPGKSEIIKDVAGLSKEPQLCLDAAKGKPEFWGFGRGARWSEGSPIITGFQTVLPPNSPSCTSELGIEDVIASASSAHADGVHVLMCDGAVAFISDAIDTGDLSKPGVSFGDDYTPPGSPSPYGMWGALGTRASRETLEDGLDYVGGGFRGNSRRSEDTKAPIWTDRDGKVSLRAEFLEIKDKKTVRLKSGSGTIHEVPLNSLKSEHIHRAVQMEMMRELK
ncbi:DUF1559 family PulG-like putative transporter [Stieleria varia]|uniref:DUF1559 domain-containing protein n=1 Tax=Stieleria varia TaxID=2528005 RepID=A0A5C6AN85_9BACT|nr:DUF1559 domain-containing protein [Stieleria varia]TWU00871.1 hypothetical protein Pla52n_42400 [Stieleria varia]